MGEKNAAFIAPRYRVCSRSALHCTPIMSLPIMSRFITHLTALLSVHAAIKPSYNSHGYTAVHASAISYR